MADDRIDTRDLQDEQDYTEIEFDGGTYLYR
jgi:hypothetical protein